MNNIDLKNIKKLYGENFAKLCRSLFPSILEQKGKLFDIISQSFAPTRSLYQDIIENEAVDKFKSYIFANFESNQAQLQYNTNIESPYTLMKKAGYTLHKCETHYDVLKFRKYWQTNEELCTFREPNRIDSHIIFFAVKNNINKINRINFSNPNRQDEYGTSVISIQFSKGIINDLSIKNRYNHTVSDPDATFSNDLDNIFPGLTNSFINEYNLNLINYKTIFDLPGYIMDLNGKKYKYNLEISNNYYCENNYVINQDRYPHQYDKDKYELIDQFLLNKQTKKITNLSSSMDTFVLGLQNIEQIEITKENKNREFIITTSKDKQKIVVDKNNAIIAYENENLTKITDSFLRFNRKLETLILPNVITIGNAFLFLNKNLKKLDLYSVQNIGNHFLCFNNNLTKLELPNVTTIGCDFLHSNEKLEALELPYVKSIQNDFLYCNNELTNLYLPNLISIDNNFLYFNAKLNRIVCPKLKFIGSKSLYYNKDLIDLNLPNVNTIGNDFLYFNEALKKLELPNLKSVGKSFLNCNYKLDNLDLPNLKIIGDDFLKLNKTLSKLNLPNVKMIGDRFLYRNQELNEFTLPNAKKIGKDFLAENNAFTCS